MAGKESKVRFWISEEFRKVDPGVTEAMEKDVLKLMNKYGLQLVSWANHGKVVVQLYEEKVKEKR